jgi:hypothetical protein
MTKQNRGDERFDTMAREEDETEFLLLSVPNVSIPWM